tara:strand:+ start:102 stop:437 length:336 start_codon:yes stop_codon:yes gene_type:complete
MPKYTIQQYCELLGDKVGRQEDVIKKLTERLDTLEHKGDDGDTKDTVVALQSKLAETESKLSALQSTLQSQADSVSSMEAEIKRLSEEKQNVQMDITEKNDGDESDESESD